MTIYNNDAVATTAVTAFLAQFKVFDNGDIRYIAGADTFHSKWLHSSLQKLAWDFDISGDDEINLNKPNPSTSQALDTIITLLDHAASDATNYNIDDTVAAYLFGGSISQNGGDDLYSAANMIGAVNSAVTIQVKQNNVLLTPHWGTGINQTDAATLNRVLIKTRSGGSDIDGKRVTATARKWGDTYSIWKTTLGLGEGTIVINTYPDSNNVTSQVTVEAYTGITNTEGYQGLDIGDGGGVQPYYSQWNYGANNKAKLYEWVKALMVDGNSATMYGLDAELFEGVTHSFAYDGLTGSFTEPEQISWATGTGQLMADNGTDTIWMQLLTGVAPADNDVITGATSSATCAVNGSVSNKVAYPSHLGQFTGAWLGAYGVGFNTGQLTVQDQIEDLNSVKRQPPNNVAITVSVNGADDPYVLLARKDAGTGSIDRAQFTVAAGNTLGNATFVINEAIPPDTPQAGEVLVKEGTSYHREEYVSWTGSTFTLAGTLSQSYTAANDLYVPFLYTEAVGGSDPKVAATSIIYSADIDVVGWVRHGAPGSPNKPVAIGGALTSAGFNQSVVMEAE